MSTDIAALISGNLDLWTAAVERKSGTGRGGSTKVSLYGIDRLRTLILDLAVRGKLVAQDNGDEPARELLNRIPKEWASAKRRHRGRIDNGERPPEPSMLPNGWCAIPGNVIFRTRSGNSKLIKGKLHSEDGPDRFPGYSASGQDVWLDHYEHEGVAIILSAVGARCGKAFLARGKWSAVANTHIIWLLEDVTEPDYAMLVLNNEDFWDKAGGAQPFVKVGNTLDRDFLLPPLAEQQRIVAKVDELLALCDTLEAQSASGLEAHQTLVEALLATLVNSADATDLATNWARLQAHFDTLFSTEASIDALKQTVLELAVRGKLVASCPTMETAAELLKRTKSEKTQLVKSGKASRDKPLAPIDPLGGPFSLPTGWTWARFPEIGIFERGKSKHRPRNDPRLFDPPIYPLVQTGEVARADGVIQEFHSQYSELGLEQSRLWPKGTLCITIAANIADAAVLGFDACFPDSVVGFIPCQPIPDPQYFLYFMRTAKADLLKFAPSTAQKNINLGILETVLIPLPPLEEMARIVAKVDELMTMCDTLKARLTEAAQTQKHLADTIVEMAVA